MSGLSQGLAEKAVTAADGRRPGRTDCSNGESSKGESSRGESWLWSIKGKNASLFSLYREPSYDGSESEAAFEMKPLTPHKGDKEKTDVKGKKKADKGKAVYKDPWVNQDGRGREQQREVEPKQNEGDTSNLVGALADMRLDCDEYQYELVQEQELEQERKQELKPKPKLKQRQKQKQPKRRKAPSEPPYHETEDGWMVVKENVDAWDFSEEVLVRPPA